MANKAIFLDRDGTIIEDSGYINHPDKVRLLDGAAEALAEFAQMGYKLIVVTNQSGVARGLVSEKIIGQIHKRLKQLLAEKNAYLDKIFYCPYYSEATVAKYRRQSDWRKPEPGMLLAAAEQLQIDLAQSWMIGDSGRDVEAGLRAGCRTILIDSRSQRNEASAGSTAAVINADYRAVNIKEAVNIVKKELRLSSYAGKQNRSSPNTQMPEATMEQQACGTSQPTADLADKQVNEEQTQRLLKEILEVLKALRRTDMFSEFSIMRLIAGFVQIVVLFCLLMSIWFLMSPTQQDSAVFVSLGFAVVLQVMALTFYIMQRR